MEKQSFPESTGERNRSVQMKKLILIVIICFSLVDWAGAQQPKEHEIYLELYKIIALKKDYEKYKSFNDTKRADSLLLMYKNQIEKVKKMPDIYLNYIKVSLSQKNDSLAKDFLPYKYMSGLQSNLDFDSYFIKKIDFYRVIEYSLFRRNDDLLPENFRGLPVVDEKNYKNKDAASSNDFKPQELKLAVKFLLKNLSLTPEERRNLRKKENAIVVMDIKKYLDENGCSPENKEFVKWAFKQLITADNQISLEQLDALYEPNRNKNYTPKDREPGNLH